jgi:2-polyprenyl-3-methyl-5-hydroxy-6-metoxy-1,4-benzoquinol methylase
MEGKNVDPKDIEYMSKLSKDWWNSKNGSQKPLHDMNKLRIQFLCESLISTGKMDKKSEQVKNSLRGLNILGENFIPVL